MSACIWSNYVASIHFQVLHVMFIEHRQILTNTISRDVPIPVSENASNTNETAGMGKYGSHCTDPTPCDLLAAERHQANSKLAWLALTDVTFLK